MKRLFVLATAILMSSAPAFGALTEEWKGKSPNHNDVLLGVMGGLGIVDATAGFGLLGSAAFKVMDRGFVPDINDQVFVEFAVGPLFLNSAAVSSTGFMFSTALRWEFYKDEMWSFYALGGFGATHTSTSFAATSTFRVYPRFGLGAVYAISELLSFKAEISHEFLGLGFQFQL